MGRRLVFFACVVFLSLTMTSCSEEKEIVAAASVPLQVFKQEITSSAPLQIIEVDEPATMQVTVKNIGNEPWPINGIDEKGTYSVALGYYWIDTEGYAIQECRALLPNNLMPGASVSLNVTVQAPPKPGNYKLYFSMVQENVAWFNKRRAIPFVVNVQAIPSKVFKQEITSSSPLKTIEVDEFATMQVTVKNIGNEPWPIKGIDEMGTNSVALGYYWIDSEGYAIQECRALLSNNLMPGASVSINVTVQAPPEPGNYKLFFSMIMENVAWFYKKGAEPFVINVQVIN